MVNYSKRHGIKSSPSFQLRSFSCTSLGLITHLRRPAPRVDQLWFLHRKTLYAVEYRCEPWVIALSCILACKQPFSHLARPSISVICGEKAASSVVVHIGAAPAGVPSYTLRFIHRLQTDTSLLEIVIIIFDSTFFGSICTKLLYATNHIAMI
jgi:hypothetical protein